ncbi:TIGR01777 family oxidoreductase [Gulosibacter molinativorax]|uniref:TIGR01777 family protein n=1 Tax=Gulosibacter molinativorax TaxID=256821 RepID=A0ABT7CAN1_9MICO|nr:TIGR01777 family oxidoreductase [Gulosibacter molinativorax]MDJ1372199.1 TIGR01777 family protein [Gulosibacter molinativorax]QUY60929.1 NAD dependent epimerase/dehydratase family protein [Gulosibacter molinativorax]
MAKGTIVVAGASGLIGSALRRSFLEDDYRVIQLVRRQPHGPDEVAWLRAEDGPLDPEVLRGALAVVGLNGASIGKFPWTKAYRRVLRSSRLEPTQQLADAIRALGADAPLFVSASAVGYYGTTVPGPVDEQSLPGDGFLPELCVDWEAAARSSGKDARVALLRTSPVIHRDGVLKPLILLTKLGLGGPIAGGKQVWPIISLADEVGAIRHIIDHQLTGPFNLVAPVPASSNELGRWLAKGLRRPYFAPAPGFAVKLVIGREPAEALLTCDVTAVPQRLLDSGYVFRHPTVREAVAAALR